MVCRLSETLVSLPDFRTDPRLAAELTTYLKLLIDCLKNKIYASPKLSAANLKQLVRTLTQQMDGAAARGGEL
jgi:hypothetical protein